jgi:peptidoglycan/xylan/chitin deacetylase (PgdA/CDA1 family)
MWPILLGLFTVFALLGILFWYACTVPSSQVFGPALVRGPADGKRLTLTFDDGPAAPFTEQILDILRDCRVPATFFVCGKNVERHPEITRRIHAEGHTLGNHTYSHPHLYFRSRKEIVEEIDRAQQVIHKTTGQYPDLFRPPYGARWFGLLPVLRERGLRLVQWSDTGYDWMRGTEDIVRAALKNLRPGSVILLHDGHDVRPGKEVNRANTVEALPAIIDGARKAGFTFVPIDDFLHSL